ncbi:LysR family transcriptional regulator [Klebsiella sp. BIGb0407]|uniref:LysR family transcriptional regulator n=1 Tax=Klebsiella sp. BIGb0407 TaxID=2940603 RepID=UPI002169D279|nr:LysR family transcriptional regulator [Klebsiella sp. BIGb0407]MCS3429565.1 molybdate transport repressor ModE-like protein [Klebsiella sp. BIGb0407]
MDNPTYGQLTILHVIAREGSISAAARKLGVSAPSVSKSLKLLETKTGVPLFTRTTRRISLTDAGRNLLLKTKEAIATLDLAMEDIQSLGEIPSGPVRITLSRFAYQLIVKPGLAEFHQTYPDIQLELSINDGAVGLVDEGFDLGIRFGDTVSEGMVARKIYPAFRMGLYASEEYIKKYGFPETPGCLSAHRLITYRFTTSNRISSLTLLEDGLSIHPEIASAMICNDTDAVCDAVKAGIGIGRIFEPLHARMADREDFIPILDTYWPMYPAVYFYYTQNTQRAKRVQAVINFFDYLKKAE